jgi:hypothetical protein
MNLMCLVPVKTIYELAGKQGKAMSCHLFQNSISIPPYLQYIIQSLDFKTDEMPVNTRFTPAFPANYPYIPKQGGRTGQRCSRPCKAHATPIPLSHQSTSCKRPKSLPIDIAALPSNNPSAKRALRPGPCALSL